MNTSFEAEKVKNIADLGDDRGLCALSRQWMEKVSRHKYSYNFSWLGRPIIQFPQDIIAMQELIWQVKPELIIETGVAHGGSLVFYASMLHLLGKDGIVVGIDIDIRGHNRCEIESHPFYPRIRLIEGDSTATPVADQVREMAKGKAPVLVVLDSNHTHQHVLHELNLYAPLVTRGSYLVVFDTIIEDFPADYFHDRPWNKGNNPKTAVTEFLLANKRFVLDRSIESKLQITVAPSGYLKCVAE